MTLAPTRLAVQAHAKRIFVNNEGSERELDTVEFAPNKNTRPYTVVIANMAVSFNPCVDSSSSVSLLPFVRTEVPLRLLHSNMAHHDLVQVAELHEAFQEDSKAKLMASADIIRSLVKETVLTPDDGELKIGVSSDLAGIFEVSLKSKTPATRPGDTERYSSCGCTQPSLLALTRKLWRARGYQSE
jgi:hypothetical protein